MSFLTGLADFFLGAFKTIGEGLKKITGGIPPRPSFMVALSSLSFLPADYSLHQAVTPLKKVADMLEIVSDFRNVVIFWALQKN